MKKSLNIQKNDIYETEIIDQSTEGDGVCRIDGFTVFVPRTVVGDFAKIRIVKVNKTYGFGRLEEIIKASAFRIAARCAAADKCGGCDFMHISYDAQLKLKQKQVQDAISRLGGFKDIQAEETRGMDVPFAYRNKTQMPVGRSADGRTVCGFYRRHSHDIVETENCCVCSSVAMDAAHAVKEYMQQASVKPYDEKTHSGVIRNVFVRTAKNGDVMVVVVANALLLPKTELLISLLRENVSGLVSVQHNIHTAQTNLVLGKNNDVLWGADKLCDTIGDLKFEISPHSFFQINPLQTQVLYETAVEMADIQKTDTVFDLYCGIGTISLFAAKRAGKVIGVEIVEDAVKDAKKNAVANGIDNAAFYCGDVQKSIQYLYSQGERADVVILDPPRKGSDEKTLEIILNMQPERIVYVSCNPATLARDLKYLCGNSDYKLKSVVPVDMFPHTVHVETVVLLSKLYPDDRIEVDLDLDELDITAAESKATYEEIKAYIRDKYGFKVSSLYIAQTKTKCGIIERINYNISKKGTRVPQCPPDKENAIKDALKHFGMI